MKTFIAALLCLIMVVSLFSCSNDSITEDQEHSDIASNDTSTISDASDDQTISTASVNYDSVLEIYRLIVEKLPVVNQNPQAVAAELGIQDEAEKDAFLRLYSSIHQFYPGKGQEDSLSPHYKLKYGYAIKDLNGDGADELVLLTDDYKLIAVYSFVNGAPALLGSYTKEELGWTFRNWIDADGRIHVVRTDGHDLYHHGISEISNERLLVLCTYGYDVFRKNGETIGKLYQIINENTTFITAQDVNGLNHQYGNPLNVEEAANITKKSAGLTFTSLYTEAEIATEMYEAVLKNEIKVYETDIEEYNYLKDCKTPYNRIPLFEIESLGYVYMDVDGDSINELVIDCGDTLVLRYYEGTVYVYPFTFRNMSQLNTDGSYNWNYNGQNFEYGEDQLAFDGAELKTKELWRIVNDGEPNAEYYIDGKQVTQEEILKYVEDNPKSKVEFLPLEVSWLSKISRDEAVLLASEYWGIEDGSEDYGTGKKYIYRIIITDETEKYYYITWQCEIHRRNEDDNYVLSSTNDYGRIRIERNSGKCANVGEPEGKG